jgi:ABC-type sugar transport system ATPase subunit
LKDLQRRYDLAILMVTHDLEEAFFLGDTVSIVLDGKVRQQGRKRDVYEHPASIEVAEFLGIRNLFHVETKRVVDDALLVYCEDLGTTLRLPPTLKSSSNGASSFAVGIRSEGVEILMPKDLTPDVNTLIEGTIQDTFENGAFLTLIITSTGSSTSLEAALPRIMAMKLGLSKGSSIFLRLPEERLFIIDPGSSSTFR